MKIKSTILLLGLLLSASASSMDIENASVSELVNAQKQQQLSAQDITRFFLARINQLNPQYRAIITVSNSAMQDAEALDKKRLSGEPLGLLHGIPVLLKDNIDTADGMPNTAGSWLLRQNFPQKDADLVTNLRNAGAILIGKANLSEWANFRSTKSSSGWSSVGGQTGNANDPLRSPCGSSSGSSVAVALKMVPLAVGTETDGSVTCPAAMNGVVGIKPSVGIISQQGIIPISALQDTAGAMAGSVADATVLIRAMAGETLAREVVSTPDALRIGVVSNLMGYSQATDKVFENTLETLSAQGVTLVRGLEIEQLPEISELEFKLLLWDFKDAIAEYLRTTRLPYQTLEDLIKANRENASITMPLFDQELFIMSEATAGRSTEEYDETLRNLRAMVRQQGIDKLMAEHNLDALVAPTTAPAFMIDHIHGDNFKGAASGPAAVAGYPHITIPMGHVMGMPVGLSLFSGEHSDNELIAISEVLEAKLASVPSNQQQSLPGR